MSGKFLIFGATGSIGSSLAKQLKNAGISNVHLIARNENEVKNNAVFPVSIPLVAGPSAITLSVLISKDFNYSTLDFSQKIFPIIIILFITSLIILFSNYILRLLNQTLIIILQKIFGLILGALSVEFIAIGFKGIS